jgi:NADP-dependent 3-hydroxy acid dehydrogenase YdfG
MSPPEWPWSRLPVEKKVALVVGHGDGVWTGGARDAALDLGARGAAVVVTGGPERALAEIVGEIAYGGGKARHLAGDVREESHRRACAEKALAAFGTVDLVVVASPEGARAEMCSGEAGTVAALMDRLLTSGSVASTFKSF